MKQINTRGRKKNKKIKKNTKRNKDRKKETHCMQTILIARVTEKYNVTVLSGGIAGELV